MRFARWVFRSAGVYGLVVTVPLYFTEARYGHDHPPAVTHPEFYYGFAGLCLAWQVLFMVIGSDPVRLRPAMLPAILEKLAFVIAVPLLYREGRTPGVILCGAAIDAVLAYARTANPRRDAAGQSSDVRPR